MIQDDDVIDLKMRPTPFSIASQYNRHDIDFLKQRLNNTRWPDQLHHPANDDWQYGSELATIVEWTNYWANSYNWDKECLKIQNMGPHYTVQIDSRQLHFIHQPCTTESKSNTAPPLLLCHGWPGSVWEFEDVIQELAKDFHVVVPSMPGYGWSEGFHQAHEGHVPNVARVFIKLMQGLGYSNYYAQGGDWGSIVAQSMARLDTTGCQGIHLNMLPVGPQPDMDGSELTAIDKQMLASSASFRMYGIGYQNIQQTRPQTLSYGLTDSPVGLLAWVLEKVRDWSDCNGNIESIYTKDKILTNVMIYWLTNSIGSSMRLYYESQGVMKGTSKEMRVLSGQYITQPTACAQFPKDIYYGPKSWMEKVCNVQRYTLLKEGGHFAAMEKPKIFVEDVKDFFLNQLGGIETKKSQSKMWLNTIASNLSPQVCHQLVVHRGFHSKSDDVSRPLENTLEAYKFAWNSGIHHCECDIALTIDQHLILCHDTTYQRLAQFPLNFISSSDVTKLTLAQIQSIQFKNKSQRPCLLIDVLKLAHSISPNSRMLIEIKRNDPAAATALSDLLIKHSYLTSTIAFVMSFDHNIMHHFSKLCKSKKLPIKSFLLATGNVKWIKSPVYFDINGGTKAKQKLHELMTGRKTDTVLDGLHIQFDKSMLVKGSSGQMMLLDLIQTWKNVGVWGTTWKNQDNLLICTELMNKGVKYVNTDLPLDFVEGSSTFTNSKL